VKNRSIKFVTISTFALLFVCAFAFDKETGVRVDAMGDAAADYTAKCKTCHGASAEKAFDPAKTLDHHIEIILKGKKDSKPPMPGYEAKGMTADEAKALAEHMLALRNPK
jgi:mono/diheme cytochrome c family protein